MVSLSRYKKSLQGSKNNFFNLLEDLFSDFGSDMKADIKENENDYVVEVELPGISKKEIGIEVEYDRLVVSIVRQEDTTSENDHYLKKERKYDSRSRSFNLPNIINDQATANFNNGILTVVVPKREPGFNNSKIISID